ncbi:ABC transporter ATP-binding protein [Terribacillus saccharophilus]|uniref:ABC transporter ATP-binding protein n=1 Tax=Terribacillus saccharophilus TaxID=361277 RepID=UPI0039823175
MLKLNHISKSFQGHAVLEDITFQIKEGESILLLGANGAGKSTLLKIIMQMIRQDHGKMIWNIKRPQIGYVPQAPSMIANLTVKQFASYVLALHGRKAQTFDVLQQAGLEAKSKVLAEDLSVGQMKRLLFQLAAATKPKLLILDEPTAGMDMEAKQIFRKQLSAAREDGASLLLTSHILSEAEELTDRLLYLEGGVIKEDRTINEIRLRKQSISFRTVGRNNTLLVSMGYMYKEGIFHKLSNDAAEDLKYLIEKGIQLKQLEIKGDTLERYVDELHKKEMRS